MDSRTFRKLYRALILTRILITTDNVNTIVVANLNYHCYTRSIYFVTCWRV